MSERPSVDVRQTNVSSGKLKLERDGGGRHHVELLVKTVELTERDFENEKKKDQEQCCHVEGVGRGEGPGRTLWGSARREGQSPSQAYVHQSYQTHARIYKRGSVVQAVGYVSDGRAEGPHRGGGSYRF